MSRDGRIAFTLATGAVLAAALFTVWAVAGSAYDSGASVTEMNHGLGAWLVVAAPLAVATPAWVLLHVACRRNLRGPRAAAQAMAWLLVAFSVVSAASIGLLIGPLAIALVVAASFTPVER